MDDDTTRRTANSLIASALSAASVLEQAAEAVGERLRGPKKYRDAAIDKLLKSSKEHLERAAKMTTYAVHEYLSAGKPFEEDDDND